MGQTCCGCVTGQEKDVDEVSGMRDISEKRQILVEDVEEDILLVQHNSQEATKRRRPTELKDMELKQKVDQWFASPKLPLNEEGKLSLAEAAFHSRKSLKDVYGSPRGHALIDGTFLAMSLNDDYISKEELFTQLKDARR